jgi:hypothetical protein
MAQCGKRIILSMDSLVYILSRLLTVIAAIGAVGCLLVIPFTAASILRVAFEKDTETELAETSRAFPTPLS